MGLTTVAEELKSLLIKHDPDIVVLTETKLVEENHSKNGLRTPSSTSINYVIELYTLQLYGSCT